MEKTTTLVLFEDTGNPKQAFKVIPSGSGPNTYRLQAVSLFLENLWERTQNK